MADNTEKIKLTRTVIVEGKYDKIKLSSIAQGTVIAVNGFDIYKNKELCRLIVLEAEKNGLIVMTDSDRAGRQIRAYIKKILPSHLQDNVINIHIPKVMGKEKRKAAPSKEGTLGVEGIDADELRALLKKACEADAYPLDKERITKNDMFELGLTGCANASEKRERLCRQLGLPVGLSSSALADVLNSLYTKKKITELCGRLDKEDKEE